MEFLVPDNQKITVLKFLVISIFVLHSRKYAEGHFGTC